MNTDDNIKKLLLILKDENRWMTSKELSNIFNTNPRQIKYLVTKINEEKQYISSSRMGYKINLDNYKAITNPKMLIPNSSDERRKIILEELVVHNKVTTIDDLLNRLCISYNTFQNELVNWRKELKQYNIYLKIKNNKIYSIGSITDKQQILKNIVMAELKNRSFSLENLQKYFININLKDLRKIVIDVFSKYEYFLDNFSLLNYVLHIALLIELRINDIGAYHQSKEILSNKTDSIPHMEAIIQDITKKLNDYFKYDLFTYGDICEVSMLVATRIISKKDQKDQSTNLNEVAGEEASSICNEVFELLKNNYEIEVDNTQFALPFALHIKNLIIRCNKNLLLKNGQFINLRVSYPFLYVVATQIAYIINKHTLSSISEDEIAYIALHVGVIMEGANAQKSNLLCSVFVPDYYDICKNICHQLIHNFNDIILIKNVATTYEQLVSQLDDIDVVITTYNGLDIDKPVIEIGPFINDDNFDTLRTKIQHLIDNKQNELAISKIKVFLKEETCFFNQTYKNTEDAINTISNKLYENKLVSKDYAEKLFEHEKISPSSFDKIVITHSLDNSDSNSFISLSINKNPIDWGNNKVNIIFVISLINDDKNKFRDLFNFLIKLVSNQEIFTSLIKANSYGELLDLLKLYF